MAIYVVQYLETILHSVEIEAPLETPIRDVITEALSLSSTQEMNQGTSDFRCIDSDGNVFDREGKLTGRKYKER